MLADPITVPILIVVLIVALCGGVHVASRRRPDAWEVLDAHADRLSLLEQSSTVVKSRVESLTYFVDELQDRVVEHEGAPHSAIVSTPLVPSSPTPAAKAGVKKAAAKKAAPAKKAPRQRSVS